MFVKGDRVIKVRRAIRGTVMGICKETIPAFDKDGNIKGEAQSKGDIKVHWDGTEEGQYEAVTPRLLTKI